MKILFVVGNLYLSNDANVNIAKLIAEEFANQGIEVHMLGLSTDDQVVSRTLKNIKMHYIASKNSKESAGNSLNFVKNLTNRISSKMKADNLVKKYIKEIERLTEISHFDAIIGVTFPFNTIIALARAKVSAKKYMYQLDPYHSHYIHSSRYSKIRTFLVEKSVYSKIDGAFVTKLIYQDNSLNHLKKYRDKMFPINFPNIRRILPSDTTNGLLYDSEINCVFIGNLYQDIRNPKFLLEVFSRINNSNISLHFFGGGDSRIIDNYVSKKNHRVYNHGIVPKEMADRLMQQADILVNIGNTISNQLPSKLFDYVSTGKPILNFIKIDNCPSLEILNDYPLKMNLWEDNSKLDEYSVMVEHFVLENSSKRVEFESIEAIYHEYTSASVSQAILGVINKPRL